MKILGLLVTAFFCLTSYGAQVEGKLFYKLPSGDLVKRAVTLEVPSRGQGEVVLSGERFEWRTTDFWSSTENGRTTFTAAFKTQFRDFRSTIAFHGTYIKADNKIVYYGDFFKKPGHEETNQDISDFEHNGGFAFSYDR